MSGLTSDEREELARALGCEFHDRDYGECAACGSHAEQVWDDGLDAIVDRRVNGALLNRSCDHEAQIRDLLEEREELLTEIRRLRMGNHPAGRALAAARLEPTQRDAVVTALREALEDRDAEAGGDRG